MLSNNLIILKQYIDALTNHVGNIDVTIANITLTLDNKNVVGDAIESWIIHYLSSIQKITNIAVQKNNVSQTFPDAYLKNLTNGVLTNLEIKTFDIQAEANFDIANFHSYVDSLTLDPSKLDTDYLVIGYSLNNSVLKIEKIWYKKVWELCCPSRNWDLKLQIKRNVIYNIRPCNLTGRTLFHPFNTKYEFINAIQKVLDNYNQTKSSYSDWKTELLKKIK